MRFEYVGSLLRCDGVDILTKEKRPMMGILRACITSLRNVRLAVSQCSDYEWRADLKRILGGVGKSGL